MTLFYCAWDREGGPVSLLLDAPDEGKARELAAAYVEDEPPKRCLEMGPGVFVAEVEIEILDEDEREEDDEDGTIVVVDPSPLLASTIKLLEAAGAGEPGAVVVDAPPCEAEAEDEDTGATHRCVLVDDGHTTHATKDGVEWSDA